MQRKQIYHIAGLILLLSLSLGLFLGVAEYLIPRGSLTILEVVGPAISIGGYFAPAQTVVNAVRRSAMEDIPIPMFVSQLLLCIVSIAYGLKIANLPILITNSIGAGLQVVWLTCWYLIGWRTRPRRNPLNPVTVATLLSLFLGGVATLLSQLEANLIGVLSLVMSFAFSLSPLMQLPLIVRTRNSASMPLSMAGMMFLGNVCWGVYGYLLDINVILIPCLLGLEISLLFVAVNLWCWGLFPLDLTFLGKLFHPRPEEAQALTTEPALD